MSSGSMLRFWFLLFLALASQPAVAATTRIAAELIAESSGHPGETVTLAIRMTPEAGWHGYWRNPGDAGLGMTIDWDQPMASGAGALRYPVPATLLVSGLMNHVYKGEYALLLSFRIPEEARPGKRLLLSGQARWLACTETICVPETARIATTLVVVASNAQLRRDPRFDHWRQAMPAPLGGEATFSLSSRQVRLAIPLPRQVPLDAPHFFIGEDKVADYAAPQVWYRDGNRLVVELARARFAPQSPGRLTGVLRLNPAGDGLEISARPGTVPVGTNRLEFNAAPLLPALPWLLLAALAGGLLLNVMPCVFPILSLKAISLARAGESEAKARGEGLAYAAGVVLACSALGGLLLVLRAAGSEIGWAFQLQEPLVVAGLLMLATTITANLAGLFELSVPGFAQARHANNNAFATGLLAAFVATPCTGPFMASAMGAALLLPAPSAMALFVMLGLGISLPFLAIAFVPELRRRLPRPGAWMVSFRRWMALPMGLSALALVWLCWRLAGEAFALSCVLLGSILIAALVLAGRRQCAGRSARSIVAGALVLVGGVFMLGLPMMVREPAREAQSLLSVQPFSEEALAQARASNKPVFAWFTADWCLTCKVNEQVAIEREDVRDAFARKGVIVLRGDWTRRDAGITRYLTSRGAAGVPLYVWYPPGGEGEVLPQVLSPAMLIERADRQSSKK